MALPSVATLASLTTTYTSQSFLLTLTLCVLIFWVYQQRELNCLCCVSQQYPWYLDNTYQVKIC